MKFQTAYCGECGGLRPIMEVRDARSYRGDNRDAFEAKVTTACGHRTNVIMTYANVSAAREQIARAQMKTDGNAA